MALIDKAMVEKIAALAHLRLSEDEVTYYQEQLGKVLGFIEQLETFESSLLPSDWRADLHLPPTPERDDQALVSTAMERVLSAAPRVVGTAFQVPRIIE